MSLETHSFAFGDFVLDTAEQVLLENGRPVRITPKSIQLLQILVENRGHIVEKRHLLDAIWSDSFVEEGNLAFTVTLLRKALNDDKGAPRFIETVARRGYRFIATVQENVGPTDVVDRKGQTVSIKEVVRPISAHKPAVAVGVLVLMFALIGLFFLFRNIYKPSNAAVLLNLSNIQPLSTNGEVGLAVISSDGKDVIYTSGLVNQMQSVWLRQLDSGNNVQIIPPSDNYYFGLALSPDNNFIYFVRASENGRERPSVYRMSVFGGLPKKIIDNTEGWISLSPDGRQISYVRCNHFADDFCSLFLANADDGGSETKLTSRPWPFRLSANVFSRDGRSVAFAAGQSESASNDFSLMAVNLQGGERQLSSEKFFNIRSIAWLPDERNLLITARKSTEPRFGIVEVNSDNGEVTHLATGYDNLGWLSLDRSANQMVVTKEKAEFRLDLYPISKDAKARTITNATSVGFAPDGKILFSSDMTGSVNLWITDAGAREPRQLTNSNEDFLPVTSRDGSIVFFCSTRSGEAQVWQMKIDGTDQTQLTRKEGGFPSSQSSDGEWLYYHSAADRSLRRVSLKSGEEQPVILENRRQFAISPDGSHTAYFGRMGDRPLIFIAALADGHVEKSIPIDQAGSYISEIAWMPNSESVAFILTENESDNSSFWLQPINRGPAKQVFNIGNEEIRSWALAPDGKSFALVHGSWKHDAILISGMK